MLAMDLPRVYRIQDFFDTARFSANSRSFVSALTDRCTRIVRSRTVPLLVWWPLLYTLELGQMHPVSALTQ